MIKGLRPAYNKKGDIPITILVIGVFVVCTLALLNFYIETSNDKNFFQGVILIEKIREFSNDIKFYDNKEVNKDPLKFSGLSGEGIEDGNFKFEGKIFGENYLINGTLLEKNYFSKNKQLVNVEYTFRK